VFNAVESEVTWPSLARIIVIETASRTALVAYSPVAGLFAQVIGVVPMAD
jgi:hypothetical protein